MSNGKYEFYLASSVKRCQIYLHLLEHHLFITPFNVIDWAYEL